MYGPASISGTSTHRERPNVREGEERSGEEEEGREEGRE